MTELARCCGQLGERSIHRAGSCSHVVAIWPLAAFGVPQCSDAEVETLQPTPQIYARRGEVRLQLTPIGSEEVCVSDSGRGRHERLLGSLSDCD